VKISNLGATRNAGRKRRTVVGDSLEELRSSLADIDRIRVANVIIGAGYTGVSLPSGQVGLAYSLLSEYVPICCELIKRAGYLSGSSALELARLALSWDIRSRVVGVATLNALSQLSLSNYANRILTSKGDIADHLTVKGDVVAVVGNIAPTVRKLRAKAKRVYVLERNLDLRDDETLPDTAAEEVIPESDIVLITGTSIVNGTVDRLLELSRNAREVALVGATAGIPPTVLFKHGATAVATVKVTDAERAMRIIAEGGGTPSLANAVEFVIHRPAPRAGER
jgi:uncharacterized protein (DUF4213/DUF364 family)